MKRNNNTRKKPAFEKLPRDEPGCLDSLDWLSRLQSGIIGTISFPVRGEPDFQPLHDNSDEIARVITQRQPALLLCAGWSVPTERSLDTIIQATQGVKTQVVLETTRPDQIYFRIVGGRKFRMGEQFFSERAETDNPKLRGAKRLANALPARSFPFSRRTALLLVCGEVMVVTGRNEVAFHSSVPQVLKDAVCAPAALILNPTHTRMGNTGSVHAWRKYLSSGRRVYISVSNWDVNTGQGVSDTLHSLWHNGEMKPTEESVADGNLCYREWIMPESGEG